MESDVLTNIFFHVWIIVFVESRLSSVSRRSGFSKAKVFRETDRRVEKKLGTKINTHPNFKGIYFFYFYHLSQRVNANIM